MSSFEGHQGWKEGEDIWYCCKASIHQLPALKEQSSQEERNLHGEKFGNHKGGSPEGPSKGYCPQDEIERLSCPLPWSWAAVQARSKSRDYQPHESMECKKRHHHVQFSEIHTMPQLVRESPESSEGELTPKDSDLGEPPELEPGVTSFLTGLAESSKEEGSPLEPPIGEFSEWVNWKAEMNNTPDWWRELLVLLEVPNCKKLAWQV